MTAVAPQPPTLRERLRTRRQKHYAAYDAFLSYSHVDLRFAADLQRALERFAKPWNQVRAMKVFRDVSSLAPESGLWTSIERQLQKSSWLVLLASPEAARSPWVDREVEWWLEHRSVDRLLIVHTAGDLDWDDAANDFGATAAVPPALRGRLAAEPSWVDARWSRDPGHDASGLEEVAASLASPIKDVPKDELNAAAVHEHRRTMRLARLALVSLAILLVAAVAGGVIAYVQRNTAREQANLAVSRQLAAVANREASSNVDVALLLAVEAYKRDANPQSAAALTTVSLASPHLVRYFTLPAPVTAFDGSADGRIVAAGLADGRVMRWEARTRTPREVAKLGGEVTAVAIDANGDTLVATDGTILTEDSTALIVRAGGRAERIAVPEGQAPSAVGISPSGRTVLVYGSAPIDGGEESVSVVDGRTGEARRVRAATDIVAPSRFIFPSDDEVVSFNSGYGIWTRRAIANWETIDSGNVAFGTQQIAGHPSADGEFMTATNGLPDIPVWRMRGRPVNERPTLTGSAPISNPDALALSPDGSRLAVSDTGTIYVADTTRPGAETPVPVTLTGNGDVADLRFFGGNSRLLSSSGRKVVLWDLTQRDRLGTSARVPIGGDCGACGGPRVALSPDDSRVAILDGFGSDGAIVDLRTGRSERVSAGGAGGPPLWSRDGTVVFPFEGGSAGTATALPRDVRRWRAGTSDQPVLASGTTRDSAVIVDSQGRISVQDLQNGAIAKTISAHRDLELGDDALTAAAVAPEGDRVATLLDGRVSIVDVASGRTAKRFSAREASSLTFAGDRLFVQKDDGTLDVRAAGTTRLERTLAGDPSFIWPPVPNPRGTLLARQRQNGDISLVDVGSGATLGVVPRNAGSGIAKTGVAFSHEGRRLVTVTSETRYRSGGTLVDRDLSTAGMIETACRTAGAGLTAADWRRIVGLAPPERATCP